MELLTLNTNEINQNGYHFNKLTRNKIGFIYTAPIKIVPDDCLACDGYVLKIEDYKNYIRLLAQHSTMAKKLKMNLGFLITTSQKDSFNLQTKLRGK